MKTYTMFMLTNPVEGREDEYNEWYDRHLDDVLRIPGFTAAQRFKRVELPDMPAAPYAYVAVYEMTTDDPGATMAELRRRRGGPELPISDALDKAAMSSIYEAITPRKTA